MFTVSQATSGLTPYGANELLYNRPKNCYSSNYDWYFPKDLPGNLPFFTTLQV